MTDSTGPGSHLKRLGWSRLFDFRAAVLTGSPRVVTPEIEHGLAKVLDDIATVEIDVFHQLRRISHSRRSRVRVHLPDGDVRRPFQACWVAGPEHVAHWAGMKKVSPSRTR